MSAKEDVGFPEDQLNIADQPVVSIITPVLNGERFIAPTLESVLSQEYENWRLFVVDNGSTDRTVEIVKAFSDPRIRLLKEERKGVSYARNKALHEIKDGFFCFLDADDILPQMAISSRVDVFLSNPEVDCVDGQVLYVDEALNPMERFYRPTYRGNPLPELLRLNRNCLFGNTWMIRFKPNISYQFDTSMTHAEDLCFYLSMCTQTNIKYDFTDKVVLHYRQHSRSAMRKIDDLGDGYYELIKKIKSNGWASQIQLLFLKMKVTKIMFLSQLMDGKNPLGALKSLFRFAWI